MEVNEISCEEYNAEFKEHFHLFNSVEFNELNREKCDHIVYLLFCENKVKIGLIAGIVNGKLFSPFSAPFGGFSIQENNVKFSDIYNTVVVLDQYAWEHKLKQIKFVLPPYFYNEILFSTTYYALTLNGYTAKTDINYHFCLSDFVKYENGGIKKSVLQNIHKAQVTGQTFRQVTDNAEIAIAADIIRVNKESKGRVMQLGVEQLMAVNRIVPVDFFLVSQCDIPIASAVVYWHTDTIVQFIYWGDLPEYSINRPMNFLAYKLFEYYTRKGVKIMDLATASLNGEPNFGLCNFKESLGCIAGLRHTFEKVINI